MLSRLGFGLTLALGLVPSFIEASAANATEPTTAVNGTQTAQVGNSTVPTTTGLDEGPLPTAYNVTDRVAFRQFEFPETGDYWPIVPNNNSAGPGWVPASPWVAVLKYRDTKGVGQRLPDFANHPVGLFYVNSSEHYAVDDNVKWTLMPESDDTYYATGLFNTSTIFAPGEVYIAILHPNNGSLPSLQGASEPFFLNYTTTPSPNTPNIKSGASEHGPLAVGVLVLFSSLLAGVL